MGATEALPITNRRYGRLKISCVRQKICLECATAFSLPLLLKKEERAGERRRFLSVSPLSGSLPARSSRGERAKTPQALCVPNTTGLRPGVSFARSGNRAGPEVGAPVVVARCTKTARDCPGWHRLHQGHGWTLLCNPLRISRAPNPVSKAAHGPGILKSGIRNLQSVIEATLVVKPSVPDFR